MKITWLHKNRPFSLGFTAGFAAGVVASGVMLFLSVTWNGLSLPDIFGSTLIGIMPASLFASLHQAIGPDAKHIFFYGILIGQCLVFALSGAFFYQQIARQGERPHYYHGLLLALALWLFAGLVLLPLTQEGIFGANLDAGIGNGMLSLALVGLVFGLLFIVITNWLLAALTDEVGSAAITKRERLTTSENADEGISRRSLVTRGLVVAGIAVAGVGIWRFIFGGASASQVPLGQLLARYKSKIVPPPTPNYGEIVPVQYLSPEITSNDQFYVVSKNLSSDPTVDGTSWRLTVNGDVEHPLTLDYQQVLALPMQEQYESLMCISNDVGGPYMSNARWEGVRLQDVLMQAGVKPGATKVVFHAADDYSDSIHLAKALEPTTLLAVRMNGATLPQGHGFPVRMLVPGIYGMKHCKWLTRIEVVNYDFQGYWQQRGWDDLALVRMTSRIDTPLDGSTVSVNRPTYIAGVAFSGNKGISEVDVSMDSGQTWQRATLQRPHSNLTWVVWEYAWTPASKGNVTVLARAIDLQGNVQDPHQVPPLPSGSSGYHSITLTVS